MRGTSASDARHKHQCFGRNDEGQCGRGDLAEAIGSSPDDLGDALVPVSLGTDVVVQSISSGTAASCAVLEGGAIKVNRTKVLVLLSRWIFGTLPCVAFHLSPPYPPSGVMSVLF